MALYKVFFTVNRYATHSRETQVSNGKAPSRNFPRKCWRCPFLYRNTELSAMPLLIGTSYVVNIVSPSLNRMLLTENFLQSQRGMTVV